jgi:hypothetical protein
MFKKDGEKHKSQLFLGVEHEKIRYTSTIYKISSVKRGI